MSESNAGAVRRVREALRNPHAFLFKLALRSGQPRLMRLATANPRTFNEMVRYRMVHDRRQLLGVFADKLASKRYVMERIGSDHTPAVLGEAARTSDLDFTALPREYALKVSHASGGVILVFEAADSLARLPEPGRPFSRHSVHPDSIRLSEVVAVLDAWLERRYATNNGEWAYSLCTPRVFAEEYLHGSDGGPPADLKLFVFDGRCALLRLDIPSGKRKTLNHYLRDGSPVPARFGEYHGDFFSEASEPPELPSGWREAVCLAEQLGKGVDFVRVDTFQVGNKVFIGELTNYPTNGTGRYVPRSLDRWLGDKWKAGGGRILHDR